MKSIFTVLMVFVVWVCMAIAQETSEEKPVYGWKNEVIGNLNITQNNFDNWTQGGDNSWSWALDVRGKFVDDQEKYNWSNEAKVIFGKTKVGEQEARKASDEIKLESVYTYKLGVYVNPYVSVMGQSQFTKGYNYTDAGKVEISNFMDPAYFTQGVGVGYAPTPEFKSRAGFAIKETVTKDHPIPYANDPGTPVEDIEKTKVEYGAESITDFSTNLNEIVLFTSKLELFSNVKRIDEIDVNWDNIFTAKISKYVNVTFNIKLFYDKDLSKIRQLKETLAVGLIYSFL